MHIIEEIAQKKCLILGFGREGKSTYHYLRKKFPMKELYIADGNSDLDCSEYKKDRRCKFILGPVYLNVIGQFELVIKTPGISLKDLSIPNHIRITSQTDIFLQLYGNQAIGITGTKGKSTTTTLIHHILSQSLPHVLLAGNMGIPLFDIIPQIKTESIIVCEFSSHQLEYLTKSPHISILLNLFEEHLDHYKSYLHYQLAKLNIALNQTDKDNFIYNADDPTIAKLLNDKQIISNCIPFSTENILEKGFYLDNNEGIIDNYFKTNHNILYLNHSMPLKGTHNQKNMIVATIASLLCKVPPHDIEKALTTYTPLPHRLEFIGTKNGIEFYNDSISTIPQATIEALKTLPNTQTLILGGFDRGIDYSVLIDHLRTNPIRNLIFTGAAGTRMMELWSRKPVKSTSIFFETEYDDIVRIAFEVTKPGEVCLLSPAASSYDKFENFQFRGNCFKELVRKQKS